MTLHECKLKKPSDLVRLPLSSTLLSVKVLDGLNMVQFPRPMGLRFASSRSPARSLAETVFTSGPNPAELIWFEVRAP